MSKRFRWFIRVTMLAGGLGAALAQSTSDRAVQGTPAAGNQNDSLVVKALHVLEPPPPTPLTAKEAFDQYLLNSIGPFPDLGEAASAGISQLVNSPEEWGQGARGYFKRFGNNVAYNVVRNTLTYGVSIPTHEDTRYFASGKSNAGGRVVHALLSPVTARRQDGRDTFSYSNTAGIVGANVVALAWAPPSWRTPGSFATGVVWSYAGTAALNLVREYVPDMIRHFRRR